MFQCCSLRASVYTVWAVKCRACSFVISSVKCQCISRRRKKAQRKRVLELQFTNPVTMNIMGRCDNEQWIVVYFRIFRNFAYFSLLCSGLFSRFQQSLWLFQSFWLSLSWELRRLHKYIIIIMWKFHSNFKKKANNFWTLSVLWPDLVVWCGS